ncbi:IPT/TIG domain-containing protein [Bacteroidota bacterium]
MKILFWIICLFVLVTQGAYQGQSITELEKQVIIDSLSSENDWERFKAVNKTAEYNIVEAIPYLTGMLWTETEVNRSAYLRALNLLGYSEIIPLAHQFIDSAHTFGSFLREEDILQYKVDATEVLFANGDYSTANFVFELRDLNTALGNETILYLYPDIIRNVPGYALQAKDELMLTAFSYPNDKFWRQSFALNALYDLYGAEIVEDAAGLLSGDGNTPAKVKAMEILENENYTNLESLYMERLAADTSLVVRFNIIGTLMEKWVIPQRSYDIKGVVSNITDAEQTEVLDLKRLYYKVPEPDTSSPINELIDTLDYFTGDCYNFGWVQDEQYYLFLDSLVESTRGSFLSSNIADCIGELESFHSSISSVFSDSEGSYPQHVSLDAQRFLYFYPLYILSRLHAIPVDEGMIIDSISPTSTMTKTKDFILTVYGSNFTEGSNVCLNGKKLKTKFISEDILEVKVKDKDVKKEGIYIVTVMAEDSTQTEGVGFTVYKNLPEKLIPVLNCVEKLDKKKYRAWFGYENYNDGILFIEGKENELKGLAKKDKTEPPVIFLPGIHEKVFSVEYDKKDKVKWELLKEKAEVEKNSPECN